MSDDIFVRWTIPATVPGAPTSHISVFCQGLWEAYGDGDVKFLLGNTRRAIASQLQARYGVRPDEKSMTWEVIEPDEEAELWEDVNAILYDTVKELTGGT